jgi:hypothetical protein
MHPTPTAERHGHYKRQNEMLHQASLYEVRFENIPPSQAAVQ